MFTQKKLVHFFESKTVSINKEKLVSDILNDIIDNVTKTCIKKKHDGNHVTEKTIAVWKSNFPWLHVERDDVVKLKCLVCEKYNMKTVWATEGTPNVQKSTIERHCVSEPHIEAVKRSLKSEAQHVFHEEPSVDVCVSDSDIFFMRTVYMVMKEELPLSKVNSLLNLQRLNKVDMPYTNLSWTTVNEIQGIISGLLKTNLIDKIKQSEYFAILIDESTDITVSKRLSICVRYVHGGVPETSFLGNIELVDGCAHTICRGLLKYLEDFDIDVGKCVSLATDGASVMMGRKSGVGVQFQSKAAPFTLQTHCVAHRLNLAVTDSIKDIDILKKFNEKFGQLYNFFSYSANRTYALKKMQKLLEEPDLTIKMPYAIRWLGLKQAVEAVFLCYASVLATLSGFADKDAKAKGLYKYFSTYKTTLLLGFMLDVHHILSKLSLQLQQENLLFSDLSPMVDSIVSQFEVLKTSDGLGLKEMKESLTVHEGKAYVGNDELKNFSEGVKLQFESLKEKYLNNLIKNIKKRIPKVDSLIMSCLGQVLEPSLASSAQESEKALDTLTEHYGKDRTVKTVEGDLISGTTTTEKTVKHLVDGEALKTEWPGVLAMMKGTYKDQSLKGFCQRLTIKHADMFPNMATLASIALCMQITSVECERSFSTQNRIKHKHRSSIGSANMEAAVRVSLCGPPVQDFDCRKLASLWLSRVKRRKKRLAVDYKPHPAKKSKPSC